MRTVKPYRLRGMQQFAPPTLEWIRQSVAQSLAQLQPGDAGSRALWELMQITPSTWAQQQYPEDGPHWVVAIMGNRCLYFNDVEGGWGWGRFTQWGQVDGYHRDQMQVHHLLRQMQSALCAGDTPPVAHHGL